jgi:predicted DNA binding CopG/RHH family protein
MKKLYVKEDKSNKPLDLSKAQFVVFPNLKPTTTPISLRVPNSVLSRLKAQSHKRGMAYQSYIKSILSNQVDNS